MKVAACMKLVFTELRTESKDMEISQNHLKFVCLQAEQENHIYVSSVEGIHILTSLDCLSTRSGELPSLQNQVSTRQGPTQLDDKSLQESSK